MYIFVQECDDMQAYPVHGVETDVDSPSNMIVTAVKKEFVSQAPNYTNGR